MLKVKLTKAGIVISGDGEGLYTEGNITDGFKVSVLYRKTADVEKLIEELQIAKRQLIEHRARLSEEGCSNLWESS